jgi:hypothetical protein
MNGPVHLLGIIALVGTVYAADGATSPCEGDVAGSYDLLVCKGACDFSSPKNVLVRGFVILEAEEFSTSEIMEPIRQVFGFGYSFAQDPRGCFVLETLEQNRTYAGIIPIGFTAWSWQDRSITFELYASPDAFYTTWVKLTKEGFSGQGASSGVGAAAPGWSPDIVIGRRIGPPERMKCIKEAILRLPK